MSGHAAAHLSGHVSATPPAGSSDRTPSYSLAGGSLPGQPPAKKSSTTGMAMAIGFLAVTLAITGIALVKFAGAGAPAAQTTAAVDSATPPAIAPAAPTSYSVAILVAPASAGLELDGLAVGSGALERTFPRDGRQHALRVSAPGYETVIMSFDETRPPPASIALRPLVQAGSPTSTTTPVKTGTHPGTGGGSTKTSGGGKNPDNRPRTDNIDPWE